MDPKDLVAAPPDAAGHQGMETDAESLLTLHGDAPRNPSLHRDAAQPVDRPGPRQSMIALLAIVFVALLILSFVELFAR